eukprot:TRINITY_DN6730_c0_g1_i2.p1 TRINITY_DN6730_c0_g1~~TRINITY_DN6730_c0_g1_i2.p1  ORF type:complete len:467 (-),score=116.93 TRINITY_DN6730_c0_g1_i2:14-1414(-)
MIVLIRLIFRRKIIQKKSIGWHYMFNEMKKNPYHLLIMGGDQIYADPLFSACETVRHWDNLPKDIKWATSAEYFSYQTVEELNCFYFKMYITCWAYYGTAAVTACVPSVMMYDDHDIFDGWGSLDPHINDSPMMLNIFKVAKKYFFLFQMQGDLSSVIDKIVVPPNPMITSRMKDTPPLPSYGEPAVLADQGPFNTYLDLTGGTSVCVLDLRTERRMFTHNEGIVMTENSFQHYEAWVARKIPIPMSQQIFVVCTVPIHYPDCAPMNYVMDKAHHNLIDDVRDHYSAVIHRAEQTRLVHALASFCYNAFTGSKATILAGDVHVGAYSTAYVRLPNTEHSVLIEQFISSGIAAKPPPNFAQKMMKSPVFRKTEKIASPGGAIIMKMEKLPDQQLFLSTSNFLCLIPTAFSYDALWVGNPTRTDKSKNKSKKTNLANSMADVPFDSIVLPTPIYLRHLINTPRQQKFY